ncbi:MAG: S49 family peptidase [Gammaproteobacteria bacterium AqS3]|nr:S49 family peptidase [Gammaproteobacteria bacterium AqS3]
MPSATTYWVSARTLLLIGLAFLLGGCFGDSEIEIEPDTELHIFLDGSLPERTEPRIIDIELGADDNVALGFFEARKLLEYAGNEPNISRIILHLGSYTGSLTVSEELGHFVQKARQAGKQVEAVAPFYFLPSQYLLASYADKILTVKNGGYWIGGMSRGSLYMAGLLKRLGIQIHRFNSGPYKTSGEDYQLDQMSSADKEQSQELIDALWSGYLQKAAANRGLETDELRAASRFNEQIAQHDADDLAESALKSGLVDEILPRYVASLDAESGSPWSHTPAIDHWSYWHGRIRDARADESENRLKIGVVNVYGGIIGDSMDSPQSATPGYVNKQIEALSDVDALVLRVNSPGGSATASEVIREAFFNTAADYDIPAYVHMGRVAASGGYWVSLNDSTDIWASRFTITGSIGVVSMLHSFAGSLELLDVRYDGVQTPSALWAGWPYTPLPDEFGELVKTLNGRGYQEFLELVSEQRNLPLEEVERIAQGRVWTAEAALERGLIDSIGSLPELLEHITQVQGRLDYEVLSIRDEIDLFQFIRNAFNNSPLAWALRGRGPTLEQTLEQTLPPPLQQALKQAPLPVLSFLKRIEQNPELAKKPELYLWCELCP